MRSTAVHCGTAGLPLPTEERVGVRGVGPIDSLQPLTPPLSVREREPAAIAARSCLSLLIAFEWNLVGPLLRRLFHPHRIRHRQRIVGAVEELDRREVQLVRSDVLQVVDLEVPRGVAFMPGLAGRIGVLDDGAVIEMRACFAAGRARPEVIEHVAMEAETLAGGEPDVPNPHALALRQEPLADAAV